MEEGVVRRVGGLMETVASFPNLLEAFRRAAKGKRSRRPVARFFRDLEPELLRLRDELGDGTYRPGGYRTFTIHDPKARLISMPPFRDRVVHHAVVGVLEPVFEARFDPDSYGCRKGRGMDRALARAASFARRHRWCLKTDVEKFYESVDHDVVLGQVGRIVKDRRLLDLVERIVRGGCPGLPIGSLTSQWLANLYLTPLDRALRRSGRVRGQVRYMDDVVVFGDDREALRGVLGEMRAVLADDLRLRLKESVTRIAPTGRGVSFLGFRVLPTGMEVRRETFRRFLRGVRRAEAAWRSGKRADFELAASVESRLAHVSRARTRALLVKTFEEWPNMMW
jgi:retron-type reverse transcriptase